MSRGSRIAIGLVSGLLGFMVFCVAMNRDPLQKPSATVLFIMSGIAFCITAACFVRSSRPVTLRVIGVVLFGIGVFSFFKFSIGDPEELLFRVGLVAGGGWLAVIGKYPWFGAWGCAFESIRESQPEPPRDKRDRKR